MNLEPFDWNAVVIGYWNPAILTPRGIGRRLFELDENAPLMVEVPLDGLAAHRVRYDDLTVIPETERLVVHADDPKWGHLDRAREIAARAIESLPETPLNAAGFNIRVRIKEPSDGLLTVLTSGVDDLLSDAGFAISSRSLRRSLKHQDGVLNLNIHGAQELRVEINFHRKSSKRKDLTSWLRIPIGDVEDAVERIFKKVLQTKFEGVGK